MISYPASLGVLITAFMVLLNCYFIWSDFTRTSKKLDIALSDCVTILVLIMFSLVLSFTLSVTVSLLLSLVLSQVGVAMSWYSRPYLLFLLYSLPSLNCLLFVINKTKLYISRKFSFSGVSLELFSVHSTNSIFIMISLLLTVSGLKSAFIFTNGLMFPAVWWALTRLAGMSRTGWSSFLLFNLVMVVPLSMWSYLTQLIFTIFVPIMGRRGPAGSPDLVLGVASSGLTVMMCLLMVPVLYSVRRPRLVCWTITVLHLLTVLLVTSTSLGFPYSGDSQWPAPKRVTALHVARSLEEEGRTEGGGLVCSHDFHSLSYR